MTKIFKTNPEDTIFVYKQPPGFCDDEDNETLVIAHLEDIDDSGYTIKLELKEAVELAHAILSIANKQKED